MNIAGISSSLAPGALPDGAARRTVQTPEAERQKAAAQFEAILVRQLLSKSVSSMVGGDSTAGSVYGDMMTDSLAQKLTAAGGLGLGKIIAQQLTPHGTRPAGPTPAATPSPK